MTQLLRVVARAGALEPDPQHKLPGRGAHLHPRTDCLALAERRHAFARALRVTGQLNLAAVRAAVAALEEPP